MDCYNMLYLEGCSWRPLCIQIQCPWWGHVATGSCRARRWQEPGWPDRAWGCRTDRGPPPCDLKHRARCYNTEKEDKNVPLRRKMITVIVYIGNYINRLSKYRDCCFLMLQMLKKRIHSRNNNIFLENSDRFLNLKNMFCTS